MKRILQSLLGLVIFMNCLGQAPQAFQYQAVLRNNDGSVKAFENVIIKIKIVNSEGQPVYTEDHRTQANEFGLVMIVIGQGDTDESISSVDWASGPFLLDVSVDGFNMGASPILSVPYALHSGSSSGGEVGPPGPQGPEGPQGPVGPPGPAGGSQWDNITGGINYDQGRVGIGTVNPETYLHVHKTPIGFRGQLTLSAPDSEDVYLSYYEGGEYKAYFWWDASDGDLRIQNRDEGDLNLNATGGKVGIGTNLPSATLDVAGTLRVRGNLSVEGAINDQGNTLINQQDLNRLLEEAGYINAATPANFSGTVVDIDGNIYKTVQIGAQEWMAENLRVTRLNDGLPIEFALDEEAWNNATGPTYSWYGYNKQKVPISYGALYEQGVVSTGKLCPSGWHVPSSAEWIILEDTLGGRGVAGGKMKISGEFFWQGPNAGATNESGFSALPSGYWELGDIPTVFRNRSEMAAWWASDDYHQKRAVYSSGPELVILDITADPENLIGGVSVRCVKD